MVTRYDPAPTAIVEQVEEMLAGFDALALAGVTVSTYMACGWIDGEGEAIEKPALVKSRRQVLSLVRVTKHRERCAGLADVALYLDGDRWNDLPDRRQEAVLFEALVGLELVKDKDGAVKEDPGGRPRLRLRAAELYAEGYRETVEKYGGDAPAAVALVQCQQMLQPLFAEWG
jgi:hypothetical protein